MAISRTIYDLAVPFDPIQLPEKGRFIELARLAAEAKAKAAADALAAATQAEANKAAADASTALSASVTGGIPTWALWAGGAAAIWFLFMRKGR